MSYGMKVTAIGAAKIADAVLNGGEVVFSKVLWGDANGVAYTPTGNETALVNKRHETDVQQVITATGQPNVIQVDGLITNAPSSFMCHEVGIEDADGDLIVIGNHPPQIIPAPGDEHQLNYQPSFLIAVSNTGVVTVEITPENDFLAKEEADEYYEPKGGGVRQVLEGTAINITGSLGYPVVNVDLALLDARYWNVGETLPFPDHTHPNATQSTHGFMSSQDKTKLDGISILGGTSIMNKVAQVNITAPVANIDLLNLPNVEMLYIIGLGLMVDPDVPDPPALGGETQRWSTPAVSLQTGNGASLYTGASDYSGSYSFHTVATDQNGINQPFTASAHVPHKIRTAAGMARGGLLALGVLNLGRANAKTSFTNNAPVNAFGNLTALLYDTTTGDHFYAGAYARSAATAENRIRLSCPGRQWTAGRVMVYAVAA